MRMAMAMLAIWPTVATAQFVGPIAGPAPRAPSSYRIDARVPGSSESADIRERIRDGRRAGQLSRTEARHLRRETGQLDTLKNRYAAGGVSDAEARELETRALVLRDEVDRRRTLGFGTSPRRR